MKKNENNDYRIVPIKLAQSVSNKEIYSYLALLFKSDFKSGKSNVLLETLSAMTGYNAETVSSHLHKIAELGYIKIDTKPCGEQKTKNFYTIDIPTEDFIMVNKSLLDLHLNDMVNKDATDIKGFLVLIKSICLNNTNTTLYSLRKMAEHLKLSFPTIQKLMKKCLGLNLIDKVDNSYQITVDCFDKGNTYKYPLNTSHLYKATYETIRKFCKEKGFEAPPYKKEYIARIAVHFTLTEKELEEIGDAEFTRKYSLKSALERRIKDFKEPVNSLNYFVTVLTNDPVKIEPQRATHICIMD